MVNKALCVGITYAAAVFNVSHPHSVLSSTLTDVENFSRLLKDDFLYDSVVVMTDSDPTQEQPTRYNMLKAMYDMASTSHKGDYLVFYFAGHGSQPDVKITGGYGEKDNRDEAIWPSDVHYPNGHDGSSLKGIKGYILDNDIRKWLVNPAVKRGAQLVIIFDCCHSGTAADLDDPSSTALGAPPRSHPLRLGTSRDPNARAVSWAASQDSQITLGGPNSGFFTDALISALKACTPTTTHIEMWGQVSCKMRRYLTDTILGRDVSLKRQNDLLNYVENNFQPQVEFLNDDMSLVMLPVLDTFAPQMSPSDAFRLPVAPFGAACACDGVSNELGYSQEDVGNLL